MQSTHNNYSRGLLVARSDNRPGLLDEIGTFIGDYKGNIVKDTVYLFDSIAVLSVQFIIPNEKVKSIEENIPDFKERSGMSISFRLTKEIEPNGESILGYLKVKSPDFPGLLKKLTNLLVKHNIDIQSHIGEQTSKASIENEIVYEQIFTILSPDQDSLKKLKTEIADYSEEIKLTWDYKPLENSQSKIIELLSQGYDAYV